MSIQLNYFAMPQDAALVADLILKVFPDLHCLPERGPVATVKPTLVRSSEDLLPGSHDRMLLLTPSVYVGLLRTQPLGEEDAIVSLHENPVIEYSPSFCEAPQTVRLGRLYYAHDGVPQLKKEVQRLFRHLRQASKGYPCTGGPRIFPHAESNAIYLRQAMKAPLWRNEMAEKRGLRERNEITNGRA